MATNPADAEPIIPPASALGMQAKAQLRLLVAAIGGSLVLRHVLPAALVNDQTIDLIVGGIMVGGAAFWQWARTKLIHAKLLAVAQDNRVPTDIARVASPASPPNV